MDRRIILLSGPVASGKTTLAHNLAEQFGMDVLRTKDLLTSTLEHTGRTGRAHLQLEGERLDRETEGTWVLQSLQRELRCRPAHQSIIVDSVRIQKQINAIRDVYGRPVMHIHMTAPYSVLERRYDNRQRQSTTADTLTYAAVHNNETESIVDDLRDAADVVVDSDRCTERDVLVRVASRLGLFGEADTGYVDVIVGGQYGSEGKGQIAAFLSNEYDLLVRVGGPNAGHTVFEPSNSYTHHQLPSGTRRNENNKLLIGPGAVLNVETLQREIAECHVSCERLGIDRGAMVITDEDISNEDGLVAGIGSTGRGAGAALSRRILNRNPCTKLAKDVPDLAPYMCSALEVVQETLTGNGRICLEGTQGTALSLYHGHYPFVTSRDTTVSGCLSEAGIPPKRVRRVVMVCRTYPIRVQNPAGGTSGPMSQEISLKIISERSGIDLKELEKTERTSTTDRERRIGEFDWDLLRTASLLNRPTDIALTFADYLTIKNRSANRFEQLHPDTINFIEEIEQVSDARVSLIGTGFSLRSIIDRRLW